MAINTRIGKLANIATWSFAIFWFFIIVLDYFNKHPGYLSSVRNFQYTGLYVFLVLLAGLIVFHYKYDKFSAFKIPVNGLSLTALLCIITLALILGHKDFAYSETSNAQVLSFFGSALGVMVFIFVFIMLMRSAGRVIYRRFFKKHLNSNYLLDIGFGLILFILILFILGSLGLISQNVVILLLFLFALVNLFYLVQSFRKFFLSPIDIRGINVLGILSFFGIVYFIILNALSSIGPFPSGFDSRNFYINISKLIADQSSLVEGYQPYYWSLLMSTGFALFDKVELVLLLSYFPIILVCLAGFKLGVEDLKLDKNNVLFVLCAFVVTPAVTNQMYTELKVDFAMLFYQLLCLSYLIVLLKRIQKIDPSEVLKAKVRPLLMIVLLLGLLSGFALGIKMINMFMVFTILVILWWDEKDLFGTLSMLALCLLLFLIAGIDELSGLNKYHTTVDAVKIVLLVLMVGGFVASFILRRKLNLFKSAITGIYLMACGVLVSPWVIKNYIETRSLSPRSLLMGKTPGPEIGVQTIINNYEKSKDR